jgi:hypothetical protein
MAKAAPEDQFILRYLQEYHENLYLDQHLSLSSRGHFQEEAKSQDRTLRNFKEIESNLFRINSVKTVA